MSVFTRFFNLIKPTKEDGVKVSDFNANMDTIDTEMHRPPLTVNGVLPNTETRDIRLETVPLADNLSSDDAQFNSGAYLVRASGGGASIADGTASLSTIKGNMVSTGKIPEALNMTVNAVPRVAPPAITATLDTATFVAYVQEAGTYTLTYTTAWDNNPADYGVTVSNTPVSGDSIVIVWDGENAPEMTVNAVERPVPASITATIDKAVFRAYVASSGTVTLSYTTAWSANPALYGITVYNTPVSGDSIVVEYVKENRGTITPANVTVFNSTGWNLFQTANSYARVVRYSDTYGYKIGGSYSLVNFAETPTGTSSAVYVDANGYFNVPGDGYVIVTGSDATTYIYATWSDWTEGYEGEFEPYTVYSVDFSNVMVMFGAGLLSIGDVRDEINFNTQKAISRIERLEYTPANLEAVIESGRPYETDTNYIYVVRASYVESDISVDPAYTVSDHGLEFYTGTTSTPPITETIYGNNLKDKLRTDVVTISQQTLTSAQQGQVRTNIGAGSATDVAANTAAIASNSQAIAKVQNGLAYIVGNTNTTGGTIAVGQFVYVKGHSTIAEGLRIVTASISANGNITTSNTSVCSEGGLNALNSKLLKNIGNVNDAAFDALTAPGIYYGWIIMSSSCPAHGQWAYIFVSSPATGYCSQAVLSAQTSSVIASRYMDNGTWGQWNSDTTPVIGTLTSSVATIQTNDSYLIKVGKLVIMQLSFKPKADITAWSTVLTIPDGFRPVKAIFAIDVIDASKHYEISSSGSVLTSVSLSANAQRRTNSIIWYIA